MNAIDDHSRFQFWRFDSTKGAATNVNKWRQRRDTTPKKNTSAHLRYLAMEGAGVNGIHDDILR
jgi:hypothetical protein